MRMNLIFETEMPGTKVGMEQLQVICYRYYFAAQLVQGKQVLEVGCGPGLGLGYLARRTKTIIAGDCTEDSLRCARENYKGRDKIKFLLLDAHMLPFKNTCFDVVIAMATVIYLDMDSFLNECHRVLRREGILVFCIPNKNRPGFRPSRLSNKYYSAPELSALLNRHHFDAELFGVFPVPRGTTKLIHSFRAIMISVGAKVLNLFEFVPKVREFKEFIKKLIGHKVIVLTEEIKDEDMKMVEKIHLVPLRCDFPDSEHSILYSIARVR